MENLIIDYTAEGFRFAIAGTPKVISCIVTKETGGRIYSDSFVVVRERANDELEAAIVKAVDTIREHMRIGQ